MKKSKILSLILILAMLSCTFIACDSGSSDSGIDIPERDLYTVKVAFQIKDSTGKTVIDVPEYTYKGHAEPTILNVLDTYLSVVEDWTCKIDKTNTITQIGGMKANKNNGDYWGFVTNTSVVENEDGTRDVVLKDMSAINLSMEEIQKRKSDGSMNKALLTDGAEFTVILFVSEE